MEAVNTLKETVLKRAFGLPFEVKSMVKCEVCPASFYPENRRVVCPACGWENQHSSSSNADAPGLKQPVSTDKSVKPVGGTVSSTQKEI